MQNRLDHTRGNLIESQQCTQPRERRSHLKRAAVLLFHHDPERFVTSAFLKIGFFRTNTDLLYQDEIHGDLFTQVEKTMDMLLTKYLKAGISYQGIHQFETFPIPEAALREAVLNAIIHKDYSSGTPIQISVYPDKLMLWNPGELPLDWTVAKLKGKHPSQPFNPDVANVFFRAGMIEAWGRGIERIMESCRAAGVPEPLIRYERTGLWIEFAFPADTKAISEGASGKMTGKMTGKISDQILALLQTDGSLSVPILAMQIEKSPSTVERAIRQLRNSGKIKRVGPDKGGHWEVTVDSP